METSKEKTEHPRCVYPNVKKGSHKLPASLVPVLGHLVEGGLFQMERANDSSSGLILSSDVEAGENFILHLSSWENTSGGVETYPTVKLEYTWDGDFVSCLRNDDLEASEDDGIDVLSSVVRTANFMVEQHEEVEHG